MNKALAEIIRISNVVGKDKSLIQGGGGNTSVKTSDGKYMYIKASGTALCDMSAKSGWRKMKIDMALAVIGDNSLAKMPANKREPEVVSRLSGACVDDENASARPSVEAHLHAILDKCVIHLHPDAVGAYVNAKNGKAAFEKLFKDEKLPPLWIPCADPGFMLARKVADMVAGYRTTYGKTPKILFLAKHGLFVTDANPNTAIRIVNKVIRRCLAKLKPIKKSVPKPVRAEVINDAKLSIRKAFFEATGNRQFVSYFNDEIIAGFSKRKDAKKLLSFPALTPDELVYANGPAVWLDTIDSDKIAKKLKSRIAKGQKPSLAFLVRGLGLFAVGQLKTASVIKDIARSSFFVRSNAIRMGGVNSLNKRQTDFINNWEAEAFRASITSGASCGKLQDRLAVVTGGGSGIGRSIAIGLARAGAAVAIADIDKSAAQETASLIKKELPKASAEPVFCNVTNEKSVDESFGEVLNKWGGLDIVVNAAGVAPAYRLVDLPVDKWRFALEVNLTGYFLMAKYAARIMIAQGIGGSIINISSKTGLEASKNNTPYNATKAGELHMARGWAMELGEHDIRVNCVCPGNVFEGSKIWNPEYIKVCAKKYGIKPQEVIPYYVNKTMLKKEIKGQDVADAVAFLTSDDAKMITGQTLVVDAGQVMVR